MNHPKTCQTQCQILFLTFKNFYEREINFGLKSVIVITIQSLYTIKKLIKLFYLHCSCKKVVKISNRENLKVIKNTLANKSGNLKNFKKIIIAVGKLFN